MAEALNDAIAMMIGMIIFIVSPHFHFTNVKW